MNYSIPITNRLNKLIRSLGQKKFRDQNGMFVAEGYKLCKELLKSSFEPELIVVKDYSSAEILDLAEMYSEKGVAIYSSPKTQFDQISNSTTPEGILAVVHKKEFDPIPGKPFIALDSINNPGNVGTIIRTADWFGIKQVFLGRDCADKYNPKVVRSTMGSIFKCRILYDYDLVGFLKTFFDDFELFGATPHSKTKLESIHHQKNFGIIFGSESHGISHEVLKIIDKKFKIPGSGSADSLNVAIAVGISLYHFTMND